jgi:hypothetical protein
MKRDVDDRPGRQAAASDGYFRRVVFQTVSKAMPPQKHGAGAGMASSERVTFPQSLQRQ